MEVVLQLGPKNEWLGRGRNHVAKVTWSWGTRLSKARTSSCLLWPEQAICVGVGGFYTQPKKGGQISKGLERQPEELLRRSRCFSSQSVLGDRWPWIRRQWLTWILPALDSTFVTLPFGEQRAFTDVSLS